MVRMENLLVLRVLMYLYRIMLLGILDIFNWLKLSKLQM